MTQEPGWKNRSLLGPGSRERVKGGAGNGGWTLPGHMPLLVTAHLQASLLYCLYNLLIFQTLGFAGTVLDLNHNNLRISEYWNQEVLVKGHWVQFSKDN